VKRVQTEAESSKLSEEDCSSKTGRTGFTCEECGKKFQKPIVATISASGQIQKYYACPRCMTKVKDIKTSESNEEERSLTSMVKPRKSSAKSENMTKCEHFFGYLKKREKETPIPEECLTCGRMFECLFHDTKP
jgi:DNA-directed RNA polymerase subunit RPC12/RpoP